ncbi:hypothetical protein QUF72_16400 [Desulfobacterales bacterium HSG2]|nr:hypothetical protein [Desulfobacterales bacterium HSG2]
MKKFFVTLIVAVVCLSFSAASVWAGSKQRRRWEGVAIGIGAAILGHALINKNHHRSSAADKGAYYAPSCRSREVARPVYRNPPAHRNPPAYNGPPRRHSRGHWEMRRIWVPPTYTEVWNPGHYNHRREWVPGKWIKIINQEGQWVEKEVWVGRR